MAQKFIEPGVVRVEVDQSEVITPAGTSVGGLVGMGYSGPVNQRKRVFRDTEFYNTFGAPVSGEAEEFSMYHAGKFLTESSQLYYVRASKGDEYYANIEVADNTITSGEVTSALSISATPTSELFAEDGYADGNKANMIYDIETASLTTSAGVLLASIGPGLYGNDVGISVITTASPETQGLYDWKYQFDDAEFDGSPSSATDAVYKSVYKVNVYTKPTGKGEDYFAQVGGISATPIESFLVSNNPTLKDANGQSLYVKDVINGNSAYVYAKPSGQKYPTKMDVVKALGNGVDGSYPGVTNIKAGYDLFRDREKVTINILMTAEEGSAANAPIAKEIGNISAKRQDCIGTAQVGSLAEKTANSIVNRLNTSFVGYNNPSYMAHYAGYSTVFDSFSGKQIYLPNAIYGPVVMARTDTVAETWNAPAGVNRGIIGDAVDQLTVFNAEEGGFLYDNNINYVKFIRGTGYVIWGQKTAQRKASALDRINVRRLLLFVENSIEPNLLPFVFENNTANTRSRVFSVVDSFLSSVKGGGGLTAYQVVCDESNNTPQVIDNNQLNVDIYVQPVRAIEFIKLQTIITRTGVSFEVV